LSARKSTTLVRSATLIKTAILGGAIALLLGGCAYDYLQHTDRVGYSAGDAVQANLEAETTNPVYNGQNSTGGLGKNGSVVSSAAAP
jgi:hypothetical protein